MISHPIILNDEEVERVPLQNLAKEKRSQSQGMREYHSRPIRSDVGGGGDISIV